MVPEAKRGGRADEESPWRAGSRRPRERDPRPDGAWRRDAPWGFLCPAFGCAQDGPRNDMERAARSMMSPQGSASGDGPFLIVIPRRPEPWSPKRSGVGGPTRNPHGASLFRHPRERDRAPGWGMARDAPRGFPLPAFGYAQDGHRNDMDGEAFRPLVPLEASPMSLDRPSVAFDPPAAAASRRGPVAGRRSTSNARGAAGCDPTSRRAARAAPRTLP